MYYYAMKRVHFLVLGGKRAWVLGAVLIVAGATVLFCSWFFFIGGYCGDPWPGCRMVPFNWHVGLVGMILITSGLGLFAYSARLRMKTDREGTPVFVSAVAMFTLFVLITVTVFNPLISPYDFIRDSDRDGYTDDIDSFPHDKDRHMPTHLDLTVSWENTTTEYVARISSVYVYLDGEPTDTSVMRLVILWVPEYANAHFEEIGTLAEIEGSWVDGVRYQDNAPFGLFGLDDVFSFDMDVFNAQADAHIIDDGDYDVAYFRVTI